MRNRFLRKWIIVYICLTSLFLLVKNPPMGLAYLGLDFFAAIAAVIIFYTSLCIVPYFLLINYINHFNNVSRVKKMVVKVFVTILFVCFLFLSPPLFSLVYCGSKCTLLK
jgi:hypothetical protein